MAAEFVVLRNNGGLTLPVGLRRKYDLQPGQTFSIIDLGEGSFVISQRTSRIDKLGDRVAQIA
jgi:bifunctional DNA-binding transcriptional regulator/antitoxin component of YhaV-PrlF toxin-antitoxin module